MLDNPEIYQITKHLQDLVAQVTNENKSHVVSKRTQCAKSYISSTFFTLGTVRTVVINGKCCCKIKTLNYDHKNS